MVKKVIIVCEGKSDCSYLNALQRFIENDLPLPAGQIDPPLRFVPCPDPFGTGTGHYDKIVETYKQAAEDFEPDPIEIWVDADIYIRNEPLPSDPLKRNGDEYRKNDYSVPTFHFSFHNFEDFIALHSDDEMFARWKYMVLNAVGKNTTRPHHDWPLQGAEYAPHFQKVIPHFSKRKMPFALSIECFANLRRHLNDPDVKSMTVQFQPGHDFGEHILQLLDAAYPELIP